MFGFIIVDIWNGLFFA